jgi:hypothetical protein
VRKYKYVEAFESQLVLVGMECTSEFPVLPQWAPEIERTQGNWGAMTPQKLAHLGRCRTGEHKWTRYVYAERQGSHL